MTRPVMLVRFKPGFVGERRRTIHVVPMPDGDVPPEALTALCGQVFRPGTAERLDSALGMPCNNCFMVATALGAGALAVTGTERY